MGHFIYTQSGVLLDILTVYPRRHTAL